MEKKNNGLGLLELFAIIFIFLFMMSLAFPAVIQLSSRQRSVICQDNLKKLGVALNLYFNDYKEYPVWDKPIGPKLNSFIDWALKEGGYVEDEQIFRCPADNPHPSRVNKERARAWNYNPFEYSYGISSVAVYGKIHEQRARQILSGDANWSWMHNLSGYYLLGLPWHTPLWYSNTVAYRHKNNSANFLFHDGHVEGFEARFWLGKQTKPDTNEIFFGRPGEGINDFLP